MTRILYLESLGEPLRPGRDPGFAAIPLCSRGLSNSPSHSPSLPSAPAGCPILKTWEKQEPDVLAALRDLKPNWETSLDMRKEDAFSKSGLEQGGWGWKRGGERPAASSIINAVV